MIYFNKWIQDMPLEIFQGECEDPVHFAQLAWNEAIRLAAERVGECEGVDFDIERDFICPELS